MVEGLRAKTVAGRRATGSSASAARGDTYDGRAVILTTGTFLKALMHTGEAKTDGGRGRRRLRRGAERQPPDAGFELARFKTGTPCRLNGRTIDFDRAEGPARRPDRGRSASPLTTASTAAPGRLPHHLHERASVHDLIRANLHRAPMYSGQIDVGGPRYCPSIEDKVVRFADKTRHQIFLEPEGLDTREYLLQRHQHQPAQGRAGGDAPLDPRPGERRGPALGLRGRVRLSPPPTQLQPDAGDQAGRAACTSPARSTARPATRRPPPRG